MKRKMLLCLIAVLLLAPGPVLAKMKMGGNSMMMMGPQMQKNMVMMSHIMKEMSQMMKKGHMSADQQKNMMSMMDKMGKMMQQMSGPEAMSMMSEHHKQLQGMQKDLNTMRGQMHKK